MKKTKHVGKIIVLGIMTLLLLVFIVMLILTLTLEHNFGNHILLLSGIFDVFVAFILFKVLLHRERYICPECGSKREYHRTWERTTKRVSYNGDRIDYESYSKLSLGDYYFYRKNR